MGIFDWLGFGLWKMDFGLWEIDFGLCKKWTLDFVKMDFGLPKMDFDVRELLNSSFEVIITSPV